MLLKALQINRLGIMHRPFQHRNVMLHIRQLPLERLFGAAHGGVGAGDERGDLGFDVVHSLCWLLVVLVMVVEAEGGVGRCTRS